MSVFTPGAVRKPLTEEENQLLLARHRGGEKCLGELLLGNYRLAVSIASDYARSGQLNDLTHEALLAIAKAASRYDPERGPFTRYVCRAMRNRLSDWVKRERREQVDPSLDLEAQEGPACSGFEEKICAEIAVEQLREGIEDILKDPLEREVFSLSHGLIDGEQRDRQEVAGICGIPTLQVQKKLGIATRKVRRHYGFEA